MRLLKLTFIALLLLASVPAVTNAVDESYGQMVCSSNWKYCGAVSGSSHDPVLYFNTSTKKKVQGCLRTSEGDWVCRTFIPTSTPDFDDIYVVKRHMRSVYPYTGSGYYKLAWKRNGKKLMPTIKFWVD